MMQAPRTIVLGLVFVGLLLVPLAAIVFNDPFLITLMTRVVVLSIAVTAVNLVVGNCGLVSMGHALYLGIGAYTVGICDFYGVTSAFIQWPIAIAVALAAATVFGWLSLMTRGAYFIMITLAFGQFGYFLAVGATKFGGDDGMAVAHRSSLGGLLDLTSPVQFYYFCLAALALAILLVWRLSISYFGLIIDAARLNERRLQSLGASSNRYLLVALALSAAICSVAGILLANQLNFVSPDIINWSLSGDLIVMLLVGGQRTLAGPVVGVLVFLVLQHVLTGITEHWQIVLGPLLVALAAADGKGLVHLLGKTRRG